MSTPTVVCCLYTIQFTADVYLARCERLWSIPFPLVLFTDDPAVVNVAQTRRPDALVIYRPRTELPMWKYKEAVERNREVYWPTAGPKNGVEIHLIWLSKFDFVREVLHTNPFNSSHVLYIDVDVFAKRPWDSDQLSSDEGFRMFCQLGTQLRDKVQFQVMNYFPDSLFHDLREFYARYRFVASGMMVSYPVSPIGMNSITFLCDLGRALIDQGFGNGEEHLLAWLLIDHPDWCIISMGDYQDLFFNWIEPIRNMGYVDNIIRGAHQAGDQRRLQQLLHDDIACLAPTSRL